jgi:hypothetical protein
MHRRAIGFARSGCGNSGANRGSADEYRYRLGVIALSCKLVWFALFGALIIPFPQKIHIQNNSNTLSI